MKKKIAFALLMGIVSTCIVSFTLISINVGFKEHFIAKWLRSWLIGYVVVIPAILLLGPVLQRWIDKHIDN